MQPCPLFFGAVATLRARGFPVGWRRRAKVPILVLNATTLNTGHNWQFTASWMGEPPAGIDREIDGNYRLRRMYYDEAPRRYQRMQEEKKPMPSLVLIDGGLGQLHAAAQALEGLEIINQPLAAIAKREEIIYIYGQENDPVVLDHHSPVLHLVQMIRDEAHRFAQHYHHMLRKKRTFDEERS